MFSPEYEKVVTELKKRVQTNVSSMTLGDLALTAVALGGEIPEAAVARTLSEAIGQVQA